MMSGIARVSLRRKNNLNPRLLRQPQPLSAAAGSPRGISTCVFGDPESCPVPLFFSDKNGPLSFAAVPGETMMMKLKQGKHPTYADSSDEEGEPAGERQQQSSGVKQDDDALYFKIDMPGVSKEDAKVYLDGNMLIAKGNRKSDPQFEAAKDHDESSFPETYSAGVSLSPMRKYKVAGIKAEMKDGVLKVTVPKVKDEERTDVLHVQID